MDAWFWMWLILAAVLSIAEIFTAGFVLLPFGIGAAVAAVLNLLSVELVWQWVGFLGVSFASLAVLRRVAERITHEPPQRTGGDRLIGKYGVVTETLDNAQGHVKVEREDWRADAPGYEPLGKGTRVMVVRVEGTHLIVEAVVDAMPEPSKGAGTP